MTPNSTLELRCKWDWFFFCCWGESVVQTSFKHNIKLKPCCRFGGTYNYNLIVCCRNSGNVSSLSARDSQFVNINTNVTWRSTFSGMASILLKLLTKSLPTSFQANLLSHHLDSISNNFAILAFFNSRWWCCCIYDDITFFLQMSKELWQISSVGLKNCCFCLKLISIILLLKFLSNLGARIVFLVWFFGKFGKHVGSKPSSNFAFVDMGVGNFGDKLNTLVDFNIGWFFYF
jgi:hypothetical protein